MSNNNQALSKPFITFSDLIPLILDRQKQTLSHEDPQPMLVVGAGLGRTSTASLKEALELLTLKCYHMKNAALDHRDLWLEHAQERLEGKPGHYPRLAKSLAGLGFNATVDEPNNIHFQELMELYPQSRVILTVRPYHRTGRDWSKSVMASIEEFREMVVRVPARWIPAVKQLKVILDWVRLEQLRYLPASLEATSRLDDTLAHAYDAWVDHVQSTVPADRLLIFAATDGWKPLCDFLHPLSNEPINQACQEILASGRPYPRGNETKHMKVILRTLDAISTMVENSPFLLLAICFIWSLFWRRKASSTRKVGGRDKDQRKEE